MTDWYDKPSTGSVPTPADRYRAHAESMAEQRDEALSKLAEAEEALEVTRGAVTSSLDRAERAEADLKVATVAFGLMEVRLAEAVKLLRDYADAAGGRHAFEARAFLARHDNATKRLVTGREPMVNRAAYDDVVAQRDEALSKLARIKGRAERAEAALAEAVRVLDLIASSLPDSEGAMRQHARAFLARHDKGEGGFNGLTRAEIEATLSAPEGMADLPKREPWPPSAPLTTMDDLPGRDAPPPADRNDPHDSLHPEDCDRLTPEEANAALSWLLLAGMTADTMTEDDKSARSKLARLAGRENDE